MKLFALVGKPNVGKSTIFNRIAKRRIAIVGDDPGVTRDRNIAVIQNSGYHFMLMDTGGFEPEVKEGISSKMKEQSQLAVEEADVILFMMDRKSGLTEQDREIYKFLRNSGKPLYVLINKVDGDSQEMDLAEFWELGMSELYPISGEHGRGIKGLLEKLGEDFPEILKDEEEIQAEEEEILSIALVGRPNAGKSSLTNYFLGQNKQIVHDEPGTTRDPIDNYLNYNKKQFRLIDTAGIRRKGRVSYQVDHYSMVAALKSIERADVAVLVLDATEGVVEQDARIAGLVEERGRAMVIAVNKWDLVAKDSLTLEKMREDIYSKLSFVDFAPIIFVSAKSGQRVPQILDLCQEVYQQYSKRIQTSSLNDILQNITARHSPPGKAGKATRIYFCSQVSIKPPTFVFHTSNPDHINLSYRRFMANQFRHFFDFQGTPIRLLWRERSGKNKEEKS